ncbi:acetoacetate decarboxylase [Archangium minus]|uniref:Acetoacetate decarboxylase n=1 Tax=Archangium minus TaxID=83450 RepID=A0ABY9WKB5_9BACT|nr:acetoacetate decarboxylase [Archangium minus]
MCLATLLVSSLRDATLCRLRQGDSRVSKSSVEPSVSNDYPPAPWALRGQMYLSLWMVPAERVRFELDPAFELFTLAGRACVITCFVDYQQGSVLTYGELFGGISVKTRGSGHLGMTVTHMWVDSERSLRGGRALWGMPKVMARFALDHQPQSGGAFAGASWDTQGRELARVHFEPLAALPPSVRIPMGLPNLQMLNGRVHAPKDAKIHFSPRLLQGAEWSIPTDSPLASLGIVGARPWVSAQVRDFEWTLPAATPVE